MLQIGHQLRYDSTPAAVFEMITSEAFQARKLAGSGAQEHEVTVEHRPDGGAVVRTVRALPTDRVPDAFRTLVGSSVTVAQTETWDPLDVNGGRSGTVTVEMRGTPVRLTGTLQLGTDGRGGTVEQVQGELRAKVPLLGGKIEKAVEPALRAAMDAEERIGRAWLAGS
jgi:hypothetical protein